MPRTCLFAGQPVRHTALDHSTPSRTKPAPLFSVSHPYRARCARHPASAGYGGPVAGSVEQAQAMARNVIGRNTDNCALSLLIVEIHFLRERRVAALVAFASTTATAFDRRRKN